MKKIAIYFILSVKILFFIALSANCTYSARLFANGNLRVPIEFNKNQVGFDNKVDFLMSPKAFVKLHELRSGAKLLSRITHKTLEQARSDFSSQLVVMEYRDRVDLEHTNSWGVEDSSVEEINKRLEIDLFQEIKKSIDKHPDKVITIVDWGAGKGIALNEIALWLEMEGLIDRVGLIGFGNIYYKDLENLNPTITYILDEAEAFDLYFEREIGLLFSHFGFQRIGREKYLRQINFLNSLMLPGGKIFHESYLISQAKPEILTLESWEIIKGLNSEDRGSCLLYVGDSMSAQDNSVSEVDENPCGKSL